MVFSTPDHLADTLRVLTNCTLAIQHAQITHRYQSVAQFCQVTSHTNLQVSKLESLVNKWSKESNIKADWFNRIRQIVQCAPHLVQPSWHPHHTRAAPTESH